MNFSFWVKTKTISLLILFAFLRQYVNFIFKLKHLQMFYSLEAEA